MPSQKFELLQDDLHNQICQRCEYLQKYNVALNVTVKPEQYPKLLSQIRNTKSLVIVLVDLLDFPCSVWPGLVNLIGEKQKVYIVGNKVDLLPKDDKLYLERIRKSLKESLKLTGISRDTKIRDISLISAKTGYGVESLVTKLLRDMRPKENVYVVGCTNSGKSTLFNILMQSDLCATRDDDLMCRSTTSLWPGTTLNLLKFPIRDISAWELELRLKRLRLYEKQDIAERRLQWTMHRQNESAPFALLSERVHSTFRRQESKKRQVRPFKAGRFANSDVNHVHDSPGVIYKDQLLHLLTTEELLRTVPREIITPRTYSLRPLQTLFIGGLARLDLVTARQHVWVTVFASNYLPVNIVYTEQAKPFYQEYLGTEMLAVPMGDKERIDKWPPLMPKEFTLDCVGWEQSCADIVLSSAGWVSITSGEDTKCQLRAFTPECRGVHVRDPPLLPYAARLRGKRIVDSPCFENKLYTVDDLVQGPIRHLPTDHISPERIRQTLKFVQGSSSLAH